MGSLAGLAGLQGVQKGLTIASLPILVSLHGLERVTKFESISISTTPELRSTSSLSSLEANQQVQGTIFGAPGFCVSCLARSQLMTHSAKLATLHVEMHKLMVAPSSATMVLALAFALYA